MMFLGLYNLVLLLLLPLVVLHWLHGRIRLGKYRYPLRVRLGMNGRLPKKRDGARRILVHAVSVGETVAAMPFVQRLRAVHPQDELFFSNVTETGHQRAKELIAADRFVFFPLDYPLCVSTFLDEVEVDTVVIMETEIWPNFLWECHRRGVQVFIINARISDKSMRHYQLIRPLLAKVLAPIHFFSQSQEDAERLRFLGAMSVVNAGNLKYEQVFLNLQSPKRLDLIRIFPMEARDKTIVFGSFHFEEMKQCLCLIRQWQDDLSDFRLILAPRHFHYLSQLKELALELNLNLQLRSCLTDPVYRGIVLLDSYGELSLVYESAAIGVVGGSFENIGGHSILEPALFACAILYGPYIQNFREVCSLFEDAEAALKVQTLADAFQQILVLSQDAECRQSLGKNARRLLDSHRRVADTIIDSMETKL